MARYPTLQWMHLYVFQLTLVCFAVRSSEVLSAGGGVWAGLWLDSLCGRQNSMNQTLIVSSPQETIRCLTNHVSVFLPTPSPFTQLCSLINVWWKWWETDGHSLPQTLHSCFLFTLTNPLCLTTQETARLHLCQVSVMILAAQILKKQGTRLPEHVFSDFETYCLVIWASLLQFMLRIQHLSGNVDL